MFIGRGDLTVALGAASNDAAAVQEAVERVTAAMRAVNKPVCVMVAGKAEAGAFKQIGASAFIISSDQGFMRRAAAQTLSEFATLAA